MDPQDLNVLGEIQKMTLGMITMIENLLRYTKTSKQTIKKEEVDLNEMFITVFNHLKAAYPSRNIDFVIKKKFPQVTADYMLMKELIYNILSNAVKFTRNRERAVIQADWNSGEDETVFSVSDNGIGFDMEYADNIFGVFQKLHSPEEYEGNGIGLAIVKEIIRRHGGKVWIDSEVNVGATIYFTFPIN